jgi:putative FmdB family regulatory protein
MPIYEFTCQSCQRRFEELRRMNDQSPGACPSCQGADVAPVMSTTSFHLKGTGWYATDYKRSAASSE